MRVLLLGATGNLGLRCIPALLAHKHSVVAYVRSPSKLKSLVTASLLSHITVVVGDATDSVGIKAALLDNGCDALVDVAGNQVCPWQEFVMSKIAKAVSQAAIEVGRTRGKPMRAWVCCGLGVVEFPGTGQLIEDYLPKIAGEQHAQTAAVITPIPLHDLHWSMICVGMMYPTNPKQDGKMDLLESPRTHSLLLKSGSPPEWAPNWIAKVPVIGRSLYLWLAGVWRYTTKYEDVADFLAEDLETGDAQWYGQKVSIKEKEKGA